MEPFGPFKIFLSCHFPLSPLARLCQALAEAIDTRLVAAERPELAELMDKVKREMLSSDAALFLLEGNKDDDAEDVMSDWMKAEYGVARAMNKVIGVIVATEEPPPKVFSKDVEWLKTHGLNTEEIAIKVSTFLYSMKQKIKASTKALHDISEPTFIRNFIKHRINLSAEGELRYETQVKMQCLKEGLSDLRHSIHMNYSFCWKEGVPFERPNVELINLSSSHKFSFEPVASDATKYTWKINISPPLMKNEKINYGWRSDFMQYFPLTKEEISEITQISDYPFPVGSVEHHYFINNPTDLLVIKLEFEDGSIIGPCHAKAFVGRTFSTRTIDRTESEIISNNIQEENFLGRKEITLNVEKPRFGYNYAIWWSLNC